MRSRLSRGVRFCWVSEPEGVFPRLRLQAFLTGAWDGRILTLEGPGAQVPDDERQDVASFQKHSTRRT